MINHDLGGKVVVIASGAPGIGLACAQTMARSGADVASLDGVNIVVCNAGIGGGSSNSSDYSDEGWHQIIGSTSTALLNPARSAWEWKPCLRKRTEDRVKSTPV